MSEFDKFWESYTMNMTEHFNSTNEKRKIKQAAEAAWYAALKLAVAVAHKNKSYGTVPMQEQI